MQTSAALLWVI